jgi:hypothetical protein
MTPTPPSPSLQFVRIETKEEYDADISFTAYAWGFEVGIENGSFHGDTYCTFLLTLDEAKTLREFLNRNLER